MTDGRTDTVNAALVAAAPEMLRALHEANQAFWNIAGFHQMSETAREALYAAHAKTSAAIAKATGRGRVTLVYCDGGGYCTNNVLGECMGHPDPKDRA